LTNTDNSDDDPLKPAGSARSAIEGMRDDAKMRLFAEELAVSKEAAETGRVSIKTHTVERQALVDQDLFREHAEIKTVPVGKRIYVIPAVRREGGVTIVPVVEEVLFTERRLFLKEEVHITMVRTTERYQETVTLRHQEAVVERRQSEAQDPEAPSGSGGAKP
jgi:stress response protein YsnF